MTVSSTSCYAFHGSLQQPQQARHRHRHRHRQSLPSSLSLTPQDLTDYMAKANEAKVLAMKQIEDKKNAEIQSLKKEVETLKKKAESVSSITTVGSTAPPAPPANMDLDSMTKEQLVSRLVTYQQFISKYIVEAQEQKMKAVMAAEAKVEAKYEEKLKLLTGSTSSVPAPASSADTSLYEGRNANVAAAAKAGKSRWGDAEVAKVAGSAGVSTAVNGASTPPVVDKAPAPVLSSGSTSLFQERNQMVAAAGAAGKSRWGEAEVKKATVEAAKGPSLPAAAAAAETSSPPPPAPAVESVVDVDVTAKIEAADHGLRNDGGVGGPSLAERINLGRSIVEGSSAGSTAAAAPVIELTPEIEAADHGLRNDGGVGGPSLAERVNLGLSIVEGSSSGGAVVTAADANTSLYTSRNARVAAAAAAGKSRWGELENEKSKVLAVAAASAPAVDAASAPATLTASKPSPADGSAPVGIKFGVDPNLP
eukprot:CAMPEP_0113456120 /NCGR_PEP_ID=MMETSP0014_2-20120614/8723_1 /TAXON_ID=2857 /ORGANISM="Nitzschia sp." /LENGTH=478 /DNA_ID=CAMNT_0000347563 /DNA_START=1132 /DNA_END=2568 /DNA_ORIENTATION=- /assembly_acc=CAM_ASM_000159